jgi:RNA recognition motif-containing protein
MNIYVGNLSLEVTAEELRHKFASFGEVLSVRIMNDKYIGSGQTRGYAFVDMPSNPEGKAAIAALQGKSVKNRLLEVVEALPMNKCNDPLPTNQKNISARRKVRQRQF